jgi:predicted lysophospholipase L1 biosynthesis ABC-type transport system permease subunit
MRPFFDMTDTRSQTMDWTLWFYWIMATTVGWLIGSSFFNGIPVVISGVAVAGLQWAVLHKRIQKAWRWAILSSLGWIIGYILLVIFFPAVMVLLIGPVLGGITGVAQWFLLKKEVELAGWWIVISILAWTTGLTLMPGFLTSGALPGALTGFTLVILFRYSSSRIGQ